MYDCTNNESFKHLVFWYNEIIRNSQEIPIMMIGSKCDLSERQISEKAGKSQGESWSIPHFTISSKSGFNIIKLLSFLSEEEYNKSENNSL